MPVVYLFVAFLGNFRGRVLCLVVRVGLWRAVPQAVYGPFPRSASPRVQGDCRVSCERAGGRSGVSARIGMLAGRFLCDSAGGHCRA